jgi:acyl-CoA thioesterase-1
MIHERRLGIAGKTGMGGANKEEQRGQKMKRAAAWAGLIAVTVSLGGLGVPMAQAEKGETVIVALGDSLTAGFELPQDQAFPAMLERALKAEGHDVKVVNAGVSGDTAEAGLARLDWALPKDASAVIIELGANDALQGLPPEATKQALEKIITRVRARGLPILLAGMEAPRNLGPDYVQSFDAIYPELAAKYHLLLYPFFLDGVAMEKGLTLNDGMHPNPEGVARIVDGITPKVEELLAAVKPGG